MLAVVEYIREGVQASRYFAFGGRSGRSNFGHGQYGGQRAAGWDGRYDSGQGFETSSPLSCVSLEESASQQRVSGVYFLSIACFDHMYACIVLSQRSSGSKFWNAFSEHLPERACINRPGRAMYTFLIP